MSTPLAEVRGLEAMRKESKRVQALIEKHQDDMTMLQRMHASSTNSLERWTLMNAIQVLQNKIVNLMIYGREDGGEGGRW